jgi:uncharacterized protein (DUF433 family)
VGDVVSMLDRPVYGYAEVDRLLRLTPGTAKRWINGYQREGRWYEPVIRDTSTDSVRYPDTTGPSEYVIADPATPEVVFHPGRREGQPTVNGIRAETLAGLVAGGEPIEFVAGTYDLTAEQVEQAVAYEASRRRAA